MTLFPPLPALAKGVVAFASCKMCVIIGLVECTTARTRLFMGWILFFVLEAIAPVCDLIEGSLQAESAIRFTGELKVVGNIETDDSEITELLMLKSGQRIMNWRIIASDWLLILHHGNKFDFNRKQRPQVKLESLTDESKYSNLVVSFTEKATGLRVREESTDKTCEQVAIQYLQALQKKDLPQAAKQIAVPWLAENEKVLKTMPDVTGLLQVVINKSPSYDVYLVKNPDVIRYAKIRQELDRPEVRTLLDEVLGKEGRIVGLRPADGQPFSPRAVLVRFDKGLGRVVGGPLNPMKLFVDNAIPTQVLVALKQSTSFELLSLSPDFIVDTEKRAKSFYGYNILGKTQLDNAVGKSRLITAFLEAIEESEGFEALCFNPRHGFHIVHEKKQYDFVICYECMQIAIYEDGKPVKKILTTRKAQTVLDRVLKQAGVPLANPSK